MPKLTPLKIVIIYIALSALWIAGSDLLVERIAADTRAFTVLSIAKGWLFIAVTAALLSGLVRRYAAERDEAEKELRESERKCRFVVDHANDGILIAQEGMLRFVNPRMTAITGYDEEELLGSPFTRFLHPDDRTIVYERHVQRMQGMLDPTFVYTFRILRRDGRIVWIETRGAVSTWNGKPATINFLSDITDRMRAEEELLRAEKFRSIGVLAGGIAHDFNNILTGILANISLARRACSPGDPLAERLAEAEAASLRARQLTQQLLTFSRGGAPVRKLLAPAAVVRDGATLALRGRGSSLVFRDTEQLWNIEADEGQLHQLISNLVLNASQAMAGGGTVTITAENVSVTGRTDLSLAEGAYVAISVADQGAGIAPDHLALIFDPYFTTKEEGSGLGLAVCYSIVKNHGGTITVRSEPGRGAVFTVYLPASEAALPPAGHVRSGIVRGRGRVLVMDDEELVRNAAGAILTELGFEAAFARDGREAVDEYRRAYQEGAPYDVLIMDLTVPGGMGGRDALNELLAFDPQTKAIVSSGYHEDPIMANYRDHGFRDVIAKPYTATELSRTLARVLGRS
jgi:PAS domain S-box-containing protein